MADLEPGQFDPVPLEKLREAGGPEFEQRIVKLFLDHVPKRFAEAEAAAASGDVESLKLHSHSMKSSGAQLGMVAFSARCKAIEEACEAGLPAPEMMVEARRLLDASCAYLASR